MRKGSHHSKETKRKMRENHPDISGEKHPMFGKHHSDGSRRKMSENHADYPCCRDSTGKFTTRGD